MSDSRVHEFDGIYLGGSMIPVYIFKNKFNFTGIYHFIYIL